MRKRSVIRDTIQMTVIQFFLECLALWFNAWMTRRVGAATVGTLALAGSFFNLAAMVAGGNAMLCASRFVSEELGKPCGCPARVLRHGISFCMMLSLPVTAGVCIFAQPLSQQFLQSDSMAHAVRLMALLLPLGSLSACLKGYFNAVCRVTVTAACDVAEFLLRAGILTGLLLWRGDTRPEQVCTDLVCSMACGTLFTAVTLTVLYFQKREPCGGTCSLSLWRYIRLAVPVAVGGCLTAGLSTANDALIPVTLRQFGDSASNALRQFGTFEGIVIPVLFFPSTILCALSGILIPEVARANAAGNRERVCRLTEQVIALTLIFAVLISAVLLKFGGVIGRCMDGGELSGKRAGSTDQRHGQAEFFFPELSGGVRDPHLCGAGLHSAFRILRHRGIVLYQQRVRKLQSSAYGSKNGKPPVPIRKAYRKAGVCRGIFVYGSFSAGMFLPDFAGNAAGNRAVSGNRSGAVRAGVLAAAEKRRTGVTGAAMSCVNAAACAWCGGAGDFPRACRGSAGGCG